MVQRLQWTGAFVALVIAWSSNPVIADDIYSLKALPGDRRETSHDSIDNENLPRAVPKEDDLEPINLRYRLGYARGWYGGTYFLPRTYAWRAGYWHGYFGYPSVARYWVTYPSYYYRPWISTTYYYSVPTYYYYSPIVYDACVIPIRSDAQPAPASVLPSTVSPKDTLPRPQPSVPNQVDPVTPPMPLPPQPGEPAPKPTKPDANVPSNDVRLVRETVEPKRYRYPAYGEHLRSSGSTTDRWAVKK
ncbi:MAG: hypothetical protein N2039_00260 [Gemmataceae bacterium]|nr:hypothetical protein [Gemmataceae bacterium]